MDAMEVLARYVVRSDYKDLPTDVVDITKRFILDTIGVAIAGTTSPGTKEAVSLIQEWGGKAEATIWMYGDKVPSLHAAFSNSVFTHARELDDVHDRVRGHYNVTILPASMAAAETRGKVSGKELITAVVLGFELMYRVGIGMRDYFGWHNASTVGTFGAAAGAGKILKLNEKEMLNCLGLAYSQVAGNHQCLLDGALSKRIQPAFQSMAGVRSAFLASKGIDGPFNILEGKYGYYNVYGKGIYDREEITKELGETFGITSLSVKLFSCHRFTHASIGAALDLINAYPIKPGEIEEVVVKATRLTVDLVGSPFEIGPRPEVSAQFSLPYVVATALLQRKVFIDDFTAKSINRKEVLALAKKVTVEVDESIPDQILSVPIKMTIRLRNGRSFHKEVKAIKGSPQNPIGEDELIDKFQKCMQYSQKPFPAKKVERIIRLCSKLEEIEDTAILTEALVP